MREYTNERVHQDQLTIRLEHLEREGWELVPGFPVREGPHSLFWNVIARKGKRPIERRREPRREKR